ncbi:hypothetical protein [Oceanobacillus locisalsi]|uniref:Peptidase M50 domain-containing protein n=1 Tax=Oceanobacillus locisalsi TaxID=546107 RepID=A0ABW3NLW9_9BACI
MQVVSWIIFGYLLLLLHVWFHELGHYLAGRFIVGIHKDNIRIKLFEYPPHVALKGKDKQWVAPNDKDGNYIESYFKYDPHGKWSFLYIMGGFIFQTVIFFSLAASLFFIFNHAFANFIIGGSLFFNAVYIFGDVLFSIWKQTPFGDTSAAFLFARWQTILFVSILLLSYVFFYLYIWIQS